MLNAHPRNARHSVITFRRKTGRLREDVVENMSITSKKDMMKEFIMAARSRNDNEYWIEATKIVPGGGSMIAGIWEDIFFHLDGFSEMPQANWPFIQLLKSREHIFQQVTFFISPQCP